MCVYTLLSTVDFASCVLFSSGLGRSATRRRSASVALYSLSDMAVCRSHVQHRPLQFSSRMKQNRFLPCFFWVFTCLLQTLVTYKTTDEKTMVRCVETLKQGATPSKQAGSELIMAMLAESLFRGTLEPGNYVGVMAGQVRACHRRRERRCV